MAQIRAGLETRLATIPGVQTAGYMLANPTPPVFYVYPDPVEGVQYHRAMGGGLNVYTFQVFGAVSRQTDIGAQKKLDQHVDPTGALSVKAAVEGDRTLGGVVGDAVVTACTGYQEYAREGAPSVLACTWTVEIRA